MPVSAGGGRQSPGVKPMHICNPSKKLLLVILLQCALGILVSFSAAQEVDIGNNREFPVLSHKGKVYFGTPTGLLTYDAEADIWTVKYVGETAEGNRINVLGVDEEMLWIGTEGGLATSDLRLGDLVVYTRENGLSSDTILSLVFEEDYVWAGTPSGASRLDKLTWTWSPFGDADGFVDGRVNHSLTSDDIIWFATDQGIFEYSSEQEIWRSYPIPGMTLTDSRLERIHVSAGYTWFLGGHGATRYDRRTRSWEFYSSESIVPWETGSVPSFVSSEGDSLWLVVNGKIVVYDPNTDAFNTFEYSSELKDRVVSYLSMSGAEVWVSSERDIAVFDRGGRTWRFYGLAQGLSGQEYLAVRKYGGTVFACGADGTVHYLKTAEDRWFTREPMPSVEQRPGAGLVLTADERGTGVQLGAGNSLLVKGSTTLAQERLEDGTWQEPSGRSDLTLSGRALNGRTLAGKYDNTDLERTVYGLTFRGAGRDILREATLGHGRCEFGRDRLVRSLLHTKKSIKLYLDDA